MTKYAFFNNASLAKVAESDQEKNKLIRYMPTATVKTLTEEQFNNAKYFKSNLNLDGDTVVETTLLPGMDLKNSTRTEEEILSLRQLLKEDINLDLIILNNYLKVPLNEQEEDYSYWADYKNKLENVDIDNVDLPLSHDTFQEWFNNQPNHPTKSILQLP